VRWLGYLLLLTLAVELALWESFLVGARPFGAGLPVSAVLAVVGNLVLGRLGAAVLRTTVGAAVPGLLWLGITLTLGSRTAEGDLVVTNTFRGMALLVGGSAAAAVAVAWSAGRQNGLHLSG
jgi:hypothetical protein